MINRMTDRTIDRQTYTDRQLDEAMRNPGKEICRGKRKRAHSGKPPLDLYSSFII